MHNLEGKEEGCGVELGGVVCQDVLALQGWGKSGGVTEGAGCVTRQPGEAS
jgi:hypothetical protein